MDKVSTDDLRAAVASGVIEEAEAARLIAFMETRRGMREGLAAVDEPFEFFRGFGEIFLSVGLVLTLGAIHGFGLVLEGSTGGFATGLFAFIGAAAAWGMAEYFTLRRRMSLPSIVLALGFSIDIAYLLGVAAVGVIEGLYGPASDDRFLGGPIGLGVSLGGMLIAWTFYRRFRLPFALAPVAVYGLSAAVSLMTLIGHGGLGIDAGAAISFDLMRSPAVAFGVLIFGVMTFVAAMRFELTDPHRVTRRAACAFWLHVLAAPALVNTICLTLYNLGGAVGYVGAMAAFALIAALALAIDRRSFLMAGVVYAGLALADAFEAASGGDDSASLVMTIAILGLFITLLGAKWAEARTALLRRLPDFPRKTRLPPY